MYQSLDVRALRSPILIVSPHPDDDVLGSGGLIQRALGYGKTVFVLYFTVGDGFPDAVRKYLHLPLIPRSFQTLGRVRHNEAVDAEHHLGVPVNRLFFLCYPDGGLLNILHSPSPLSIYRSRTTGLTKADYPFAYRRDAPYSRQKVLELTRTVLKDINPGTIVLNHPADVHPDHRAARDFTLLALNAIPRSPTLLSYLIHYPNWPSATGFFQPPASLRSEWVRRF